MTESKAGIQVKGRQVFISYSREPAENAVFVRHLARQLDLVGFKAWLDEEQIPPAGDIAKEIGTAIEESDAGLFIANSRWVERDRAWIRYEVNLFGKRPGARQLLLLRDRVKEADLDPYFATLKRIEWFPTDPSPYARFW